MTATTLTTADGVRLAARWWRAGDGSAAEAEAVVLVHGFCGRQDAPELVALARRLAAGGRSVLTFDLRGHGRSEGETTLGLDEHLDVGAAVAAARADHDVVVVVGASMGGVAAIGHLTAPAGASAARPADGAVVVSSPAHWRVPRSARGVLAMALTRTPPGRLVAARRMGTRVAVLRRRGDPPVERAARLDRPLAVVHGLADRFVSPLDARELHAAAPPPRLLELVPGMGHGFCAAAVEPVERAVAWVAAAADGVAGRGLEWGGA